MLLIEFFAELCSVEGAFGSNTPHGIGLVAACQGRFSLMMSQIMEEVELMSFWELNLQKPYSYNSFLILFFSSLVLVNEQLNGPNFLYYQNEKAGRLTMSTIHFPSSSMQTWTFE